MSETTDRATPFVLLFTGRTGSTYVIEALAAHDEIYAVGEGFGAQGGESDAARQLRWVRALLTQPRTAGFRAIGFKAKLRDVGNPEGLADLLREVRAHIIHMRRRNRVKTVVSWVNSERLSSSTGDWNLYDETDRLPPLTIDAVDFERRLEEVEIGERLLEEYVEMLGLPTLSLDYETLLTEPARTIEGLCTFLGVKRLPLRGVALKNTADNLREAVTNFDELRSRLQGTRYVQMFDEVLRTDRLQ